MESNNVMDFHPGYNIRSFLKFRELVEFIDITSYNEIRPFLADDEMIDDLL